MSSPPTSNERRRFDDEYNDLSSMLVLFADPEDGQTDAEITQQAMKEYAPSWMNRVLVEGQRFLDQRELPMKLIAYTANRFLITEAEQRHWLQTLLDRVQTELAGRMAAR